MRHSQVELKQVKDRACEALRLAQRQVEDFAQQQATTNGRIRVEEWATATGLRSGGKPLINGGLINPEGKASPFGEG